MTPPNVADAALDAAATAPDSAGLDAAFDELVARVERTAELVCELDYRVRVGWSLAAADERRHLDLTTDEIAVAVTDMAAAAEAHDRLVRRIGELCGVPAAERDLATIAARLPEPWRGRTTAAHRQIVEHANAARDAVHLMMSATRSNLTLIGSTIDATITSQVRPSVVTYGQNALTTPDAVLVDGRPEMPIQGLHTGYSGLAAGQIGIDTTSNNIANANTEGYTRQRVDQSQALSRDIIVGRVGTGTQVDDIARVRDAFLDDRARSAMAQSASFSMNAEMLTRAESLLAEPDFGITTALDDLWAGLEDLALDPSDTGRRTAVLNQLEVLTGRFNAVAEGMSKLVDDAGARMSTQLGDANRMLREIADLNAGILRGGATGASPNDLIDRRDLLVDKLVTDLGARVTHQDDGTVRVSLNGLSLVDGTISRTLSWDATTNQLLHESGHPVQAGGEIGGLQMFVTDDVPTIMGQLDQLAIDLHDALNTRHQAGFVSTGVSGGALLSFGAGAPAETLTVVLTDVTQFAVSAVDGTPFPIHDGDNAQFLSELRDDLAGGGGASSLLDAARELVAEVGGRTSGARAASEAQSDLLASAELARGAAHGINLDEEMIELIRYQRAYEAAARVITAADQALDTLINRTGIVGR